MGKPDSSSKVWHNLENCMKKQWKHCAQGMISHDWCTSPTWKQSLKHPSFKRVAAGRYADCTILFRSTLEHSSQRTMSPLDHSWLYFFSLKFDQTMMFELQKASQGISNVPELLEYLDLRAQASEVKNGECSKHSGRNDHPNKAPLSNLALHAKWINTSALLHNV